MKVIILKTKIPQTVEPKKREATKDIAGLISVGGDAVTSKKKAQRGEL